MSTHTIQNIQFITQEYRISEKKIEHLDDVKPLHYIEVTPQNSQEFDFEIILFKNFYTHMINIVQFSNEKWKCILGDYKLMSDADCDEEAEKYFVINLKQLTENGFKKESELIRIYLTQDSCYWKNFNLNELKFLKETTSDDPEITSSNNIKFNPNNSRFEFTKYYPNLVILNDKEEINQKYIEIMKVNNISNLNFTIFK